MLISFFLLQRQFGYAILASLGSSVSVSYTNFIDNNFAGLGTVVVLDNGTAIVENNFGTADEGLMCDFLAASETNATGIACTDYDLEFPVVSFDTRVSPSLFLSFLIVCACFLFPRPWHH